MMYKIDELSLLSGIDIPIPELSLSVHCPSLKEIAHIGERQFFQSSQILTFSTADFLKTVGKDFPEEDRIAISSLSNFELLMKMSETDKKLVPDILLLLTLLFPNHMIDVEERFIMLRTTGEKPHTTLINAQNFSVLQEVVKVILCLQSGDKKEDFNPKGDLAREIAEKIKKGREKVAALKGETEKEQASFLSKYISSLAIGTKTNTLKDLFDLTLFQFYNQLERFSLYEQYTMGIKSALAGASNVEHVDWMQNIEK